MSLDIPNFEEIANALLFPGTPIKIRYVGERVSTENSQLAFSTLGELKA